MTLEMKTTHTGLTLSARKIDAEENPEDGAGHGVEHDHDVGRLFAGDVKTHPRGHFGELRLENLIGNRENQVAAFARHHTPEHQQVAEIVKVGVVRDGVAEIDADGFVDLARALVARHKLKGTKKAAPAEPEGEVRREKTTDAIDRKLNRTPHGYRIMDI